MFNFLRAGRRAGWMVAVLIALQAIPMGAAQAGMVATENVFASERVDERSEVRSFLAREEVREALYRHGVDHDEAMARVAVMSDTEIAMIAATIDDDPAGEGVIGIVLLAGLVALLVLLVADLSGEADVF